MRLTTKVVTALTLLVIAVGVFTSVSWSRRPREVRLQTPGNEKTAALRIEKVDVLSDGVKVSLKNVSNKTIDGIQLSINRGYLQIELMDADEDQYQRLLPGGVYEQFLSRNVITQPVEIEVLAVTFDDKTSDGDLSLAQQIFDTRRGFNKQLKRIKPFLEAALNSPNADSIKTLDKLKSQVESLTGQDIADSTAIKEGQHNAKEQILYQIEVLRQRQVATGAVSIRSVLARMKERHDKRIQAGPE